MMIGGNPTAANPARTQHLYTGERFEAESGRYYLRARHYDPNQGRFTSQDPFGGFAEDPQSLHKYAYAHCDPVNFTDPSGLWTLAGVMTGIAIGATLLSIAVPFFGAIILAVQGKVSLIRVIEYLVLFPEALVTWGAAALLAAAALGVSQGIRWLFLQIGPRLALRATLGALFAVVGLGIAVYQTYKLVTEEIPAVDKDRYVAIMIATIIMMAVFGVIRTNVRPVLENPLPVVRWGRPGLQGGDWVMVGARSWWTYLLSFKWQPGFGNRFAPYAAGEEFVIPASNVRWPTGWGIDGWWKGLFGQRIYVPPPP